jgi:multiple sugar transport system ATP-binding protein
MGDLRLDLGGEAARIASDRPAGSDLIIGFRPEHIDIVDGQSGQLSIPVEVDVVEFLGNEELIHAKANGLEIVAVIPSARRVKAGDHVSLGVPLQNLHLFDAASEHSLTR